MCKWDIAAAERLDPCAQVIVFVGVADPSIMGLLGIGQPLVEVVCVCFRTRTSGMRPRSLLARGEIGAACGIVVAAPRGWEPEPALTLQAGRTCARALLALGSEEGLPAAPEVGAEVALTVALTVGALTVGAAVGAATTASRWGRRRWGRRMAAGPKPTGPKAAVPRAAGSAAAMGSGASASGSEAERSRRQGPRLWARVPRRRAPRLWARVPQRRLARRRLFRGLRGQRRRWVRVPRRRAPSRRALGVGLLGTSAPRGRRAPGRRAPKRPTACSTNRPDRPLTIPTLGWTKRCRSPTCASSSSRGWAGRPPRSHPRHTSSSGAA